MESNTKTDQSNQHINDPIEAAQSFIVDTHEYNEFAERKLNMEAIIKAEDLERDRRSSNLVEELERRTTAKKVSNMVLKSKTHTTGRPSFAVVVRDVLRSAGKQVSAGAFKETFNSRKMRRGWYTVREKLLGVIRNPKLEKALLEVRIAFLNSVVHIAKLAEVVGHKGSELGHKGRKQLQIATQKVSDKTLTVSLKIRQTGPDYLLDQSVIFIKNLSRKFAKWIELTWSSAVYKSNLIMVIHLEETERKRRATSDDEINAVYNAIAVSALVKSLAPELYRPDQEPNGRYMYHLLESMERNRRVREEQQDKTLPSKSGRIANLVKARDIRTKTPKELVPAYTFQQTIYPTTDTMQIFEERRREIFADMLDKTPEYSPEFEHKTAVGGSPSAFAAAM